MKKIKKIQKKLVSKEYIFYGMVLVAIILSAVAAYFSVFGLSHLFSKSRNAVIIMASTLEISKLISVSISYRFRKIISKKIKIFLIISIIILMIITSLGIYSYLINAYQKVSDEMEKNSKEELIFLKQIANIDSSLNSENERLKIIKDRFLILNEINKEQENRLNNAIKNKNYYTISNTRKEIIQSLSEIQKLNFNIDESTKKINLLNIEKNKLNDKLNEINIKNSKVVDIGPLKFLSKLFNVDIDKIVNILIIIIIITFDPLAILLIYIANVVHMNINDNGKKRKYIKRKKRRKKRRKNGIMNEEEVK